MEKTEEELRVAVEAAAGREEEGKAKKKLPAPRMAAVDAFRGLTVLGMLLVNNVALDTATPKHLTHAPWNGGLHFADMIFPWFLLAAGVSIPFAAAASKRNGTPPLRQDFHILKRTVTLFLLGCLVDSSVVRHPYFGLGVLQVIGLAYFFAALLYELPPRKRLFIAASLLVAHWGVIRYVPIPGEGAGLFSQTKNIINHIDDYYLKPIGLRGAFSVIPTTALALIGTAAGDAIRLKDITAFKRAAILIGAGSALAALGLAWNSNLPFNKPLWTSSYIVFSGGLGILLTGLLYVTIDIAGFRAAAFPLMVFGANAMTAYVLPILVKTTIFAGIKVHSGGVVAPLQQGLYDFFFTHFGRVPGGWGYTAAFILFWWLALFAMYRNKIFLKV